MNIVSEGRQIIRNAHAAYRRHEITVIDMLGICRRARKDVYLKTGIMLSPSNAKRTTPQARGGELAKDASVSVQDNSAGSRSRGGYA